MAYGRRITWDAIREVAFGSITDTYSALGSATTKNARAVKITNNTNETVYISDDGTTDQLKLPENSFQIWDVTTNKPVADIHQFLCINTQFYVRHITGSAPTSGYVSMEAMCVESGT